MAKWLVGGVALGSRVKVLPLVAMPVLVRVEAAECGGRSPAELRRLLLEQRKKPLVLKGKVASWTQARDWSPAALCLALRHTSTTFKVCPKKGSQSFKARFSEGEPIFETQCFYVEASFADFLEWLDAVSSHRYELWREHGGGRSY